MPRILGDLAYGTPPQGVDLDRLRARWDSALEPEERVRAGLALCMHGDFNPRSALIDLLFTVTDTDLRMDL